jgi:hypothetical protein
MKRRLDPVAVSSLVQRQILRHEAERAAWPESAIAGQAPATSISNVAPVGTPHPAIIDSVVGLAAPFGPRAVDELGRARRVNGHIVDSRPARRRTIVRSAP